jgi:hypothetical protein
MKPRTARRERLGDAFHHDLEDEASGRHEFYQGEIHARAGGTPEHAAMAAAIQGQLAVEVLSPSGCSWSVDAVHAAARDA